MYGWYYITAKCFGNFSAPLDDKNKICREFTYRHSYPQFLNDPKVDRSKLSYKRCPSASLVLLGTKTLLREYHPYFLLAKYHPMNTFPCNETSEFPFYKFSFIRSQFQY